MQTNARTIAFNTLMKTEQNDGFLNMTLDGELGAARDISAADKALATQIVYGVSRNLRLLDVTIGSKSSRPPERLDPEVRTALRMGAYQLFFMRTKVHAAVNETVELVKSCPDGRRSSGFVNALMRGLSQLKEPVVPEGIQEKSRLGILYSQPSWLVERWLMRFGQEATEALCRTLNESPSLDLRIDPARVSREAFLQAAEGSGEFIRPTTISPVGISMSAAGRVNDLPLYGVGAFQVQDEAAQLVGLMPKMTPGMQVMDACAAPGGKTCHLAQRLGKTGHIHAFDLYGHRLERLRAEAIRLGISDKITTQVADVSIPMNLPEKSMDLILADLPCTGLGTTRRHPEIRLRRMRDDPGRMAALQQSILKNLARYVRPGGQLIYSVCSMEPEEGPDQIPFIESLGFKLVPPDDTLGVQWPFSPEAPLAIATFPHIHDCDGFFGARFIREGTA